VSLIYGFVVFAWLIIDVGGQSQHIPFASMTACKQAEEVIRKTYTKSYNDRITCFSTGVKVR